MICHFAKIIYSIMPNFHDKEMGQVIVTLTVTNRIDQVLAERGFISSQEVRSLSLTDVLVDTGATLLCLPSSVNINKDAIYRVSTFLI